MGKPDIRNFFSAKPKSGSNSTITDNKKGCQQGTPKRKVISSDDEEAENKRLNGSSKQPVRKESKKRRIIDSEDEEDANIKSNSKKPNLAKLKEKPKAKEVDLTAAFGKSPVKRVERESRQKSSAPIEIPSDDEFEKSIVNLEEDVAVKARSAKSPRKKETPTEKKGSKESKKNGSPAKKNSRQEEKSNTTPVKQKVSPVTNGHSKSSTEETNTAKKSPGKNNKTPQKTSSELKRSKKVSVSEDDCEVVEAKETLTEKKAAKKDSPNKEKSRPDTKTNATADTKKPSPVTNGHSKSPAKKSPMETSVSKKSSSSTKKSTKKPMDLETSIQMDEARFETKMMTAALYQKFKNRATCLNPGSKEIPKGLPNCLAGKVFLVTGILESMERPEAEDLIKEYGGKISSGVTKKLNVMVVGEEAGPAKLAKAEQYGVKQISEDDLLDMIRGGPVKKTEEQKDVAVKKELEEESPKKNKSPKKSSTEVSGIKREPKVGDEEFQTFTVKKKPKLDSQIKEEEPKAGSSKSSPPTVADKPLADVKNMAWVDKYKPTSIKQIIGQQGPASNTNKLLHWLKNWHSNHDGKKKLVKPSPWAKNDDGAYFKAALLSGPPGIGKTTTATLVCAEMGYDTIEFNASDTRSKRLLKEQVSEILKNKSLFGYVTGSEKRASSKHVLLMDEVDGMAGNEDRGGIQELIALIKDSSIPIICMCNDRNHQKMRSLVNYCFDLRFQRPRLEQIKGAMMSVCFKEQMKVDPKVVEEIIGASNNDIRQTINYLAMLSAGKDIPAAKGGTGSEDKANVMRKDLKVGPWEVVRKVFSADEHKKMSIFDKADLFFQDYSMGPLFVQENYLQVSPAGRKEDVMTKVAKAASSLSRGDLIERRIRSNNNWSVLPVQAMFSSVIPGEFMAGHVTGQINFPGWLGKNSKRTKRSRLAQEIHDHTRVATSGSRTSIRMEYAPHLLSAIVRPLRDEGVDGVPKALEVMREYRLSREDIDALIELTAWPGVKNPMDAVDSKVKAALTRAYNKEALAFVPTVKKKTKATEGDDEDLLGEEEGDVAASEDEEDTDKLDNDAMIKQKKKPSAAETKGKGKEKKEKEPKKEKEVKKEKVSKKK